MKSNVIVLILAIFSIYRVLSSCDISSSKCQDGGYGSVYVSNFSKAIQNYISSEVRKYLPSPHSELLLGLLIGLNDLKKVSRFNDVLLATGTIHVVVVSGYNINLVFNLIISFLGSKYKLRNLIIAQAVTFIYAVICGFGAPAIRALIMGSIVSWGAFYGRKVDTFRVLLASAIAMIAVVPPFIFSLSFQLSFLATLSLVLFSNVFTDDIGLLSDFKTTISAQILVWPLISYEFGRISLISPLVNWIILWTVPVATILGFIFVVLSPISSYFGSILSHTLFLPLDIFINIVRYFGNLNFSNVNYRISLNFLISYYIAVLFMYLVSRHRVFRSIKDV